MNRQDYIVRKALNESINEFMIQEGLWDTIKQGAKWIGNKAWNGVKAYMDYATNGEWNQQYGQYVNGSGKTTELYYLRNWFNANLKEIQRIDSNMKDPTYGSRVTRKVTRDANGNETYDEVKSEYRDVPSYVRSYINAASFNTYIGQYVKNRKALEIIDNYIDRECARKISDYRTAKKFLSIYTFLDSTYGQTYRKTSNQELSQQRNKYYNDTQQKQQDQQREKQLQQQQQRDQEIRRQTQELQTVMNYADKYKKFINDNDINYAYERMKNNNVMPANMREWLLFTINRYSIDGNQAIADNINFDNFIQRHGSKYSQDAINRVKQAAANKTN